MPPGIPGCLACFQPDAASPRVRPEPPVLFKAHQQHGSADLAGGPSWDDLPFHLWEAVFAVLHDCTHPDLRSRVGLQLCSVSPRWRQLVTPMFFPSPWRAAPSMVHPMQLTTLCPRGLGPPGGLLRGYVVRHTGGLGVRGRQQLLAFHAGGEPLAGSGKFLLAARPGPPGVAWSVHMDVRGVGAPVVLLLSNLLATSYTLVEGTPPHGHQFSQATADCQSSAAEIHPNNSSSRGSRRVHPGCSVCVGAPRLAVHYRVQMRGMTLPRRVHVALAPYHSSSRSSSGACSCWGDPTGSSRGTGRVAAAAASASRVLHPTASEDVFSWTVSDCRPLTAAAGTVACASDDDSSSSSSSSLPEWQPEVGSRLSPVPLQSRRPHWNEFLHCWCLNFKGRVKLASVKNFQLEVPLGGEPPAVADHYPAPPDLDNQLNQQHHLHQQQQQPAAAGGQPPADGWDPVEAAQEEIQYAAGRSPGRSRMVLQFGKVDEGLFVLDYDPQLMTAAEAFSITLTSFDSKLLLG